MKLYKIAPTYVVTALLLLTLYMISYPIYRNITGNDALIFRAVFISSAITGLIGFLMGIINTKRAPKGKRWYRVLGVIVTPISAAVLAGSLNTTVNSSCSQPRFNEPADQTYSAATAPIEQDETILGMLRYLEAKDTDNLELIVFTEDKAKAICNWELADGCQGRNSKGRHQIAIKDTQIKNSTIIAHEYLHYIWNKHNFDLDKHLTSMLIAFYGRHPAFQYRIDGEHNHYVKSGGLQPTEIFSYACTEVSSQILDNYIVQKCNEFINTDKLPALYGFN